MSVRNYNSSRSFGRFNSKNHELKNRRKKNINYVEVFKDAPPSHDVEALRQFGEKRDEYQRMQEMMKRKRERDELKKNFEKKKQKKQYVVNDRKRKSNNEYNIEKIMKKNKRKIIDSLL